MGEFDSSLTIKMELDAKNHILSECGFLDVNQSTYARQSMRWMEIPFHEHPELLEYDDKRVSKLMRKISKMIVLLEED